MQLATEEHLKSKEYPKVGAVIARDGRLFSTGYRGEQAKQYAERIALEKLTPEQCFGTTVYTTLEPCVNLHADQEITSCADLIISSGVRDVVIGVLDPIRNYLLSRIPKAYRKQHQRQFL